MSFCCMGMFCFFPYLATEIVEYARFNPNALSYILLVSFFLGNLLSLILTNYKIFKNVNRDYSFSVLIFFMSSLLIFFADKGGRTGITFVIIGLILYRLAVGYYFSISRITCYNASKNIDSLNIITYIKFINSIASAVGVLIGNFVNQSYGFYGSLMIACILFFAGFIMSFFIKLHKKKEHSVVGNIKIMNKKIPYFVIFICIAGSFHFIFEAQIYTFLTLKAKLFFPNYGEIIRNSFLINAFFIIIFAFSIISGAKKFLTTSISIFVGSLCSLIGVIILSFTPNSVFIFYISVIFLSMGEIIIPQIFMELISKTNREKDLRRNFSCFNIATKAIGMSFGSYIGVMLVDKSFHIAVLFWGMFFLMTNIFVFMAMKHETDTH
ncbi:MAG: MFS transporter [Flavobacteriales bacterium]